MIRSGRWLAYLLVVVVTTFTGPVATAETAPEDYGLNASSWPAGSTLYVYVEGASGPTGWSAAVDEAITAWNNAAPPGTYALVRNDTDKTLADIHISWNALRVGWGTTKIKSAYDQKRNGFAKETVRITVKNGRGVTADGIKHIVMHELGHALGIGHLAGSLLMNGAALSAATVNARGLDNIVPGAHEQAVLRHLPLPSSGGTKSGKSRSQGGTTPDPSGKLQHLVKVTSETSCGSPCTSAVTTVIIEVPESVLIDVTLAPPPGWTGTIVDGRTPEAPVTEAEPIDDDPLGPSAIVFSGGSLAPGSCAIFGFVTATAVGTTSVHPITESRNSDDTVVSFDGMPSSCLPPGVPEAAPTALLAAAGAMFSFGMYAIRRRSVGRSGSLID